MDETNPRINIKQDSVDYTSLIIHVRACSKLLMDEAQRQYEWYGCTGNLWTNPVHVEHSDSWESVSMCYLHFARHVYLNRNKIYRNIRHHLQQWDSLLTYSDNSYINIVMMGDMVWKVIRKPSTQQLHIFTKTSIPVTVRPSTIDLVHNKMQFRK